MRAVIARLALRSERDVVAARKRARQVAALLGFDTQAQTRLATAVSEIARNATCYAHGVEVEVEVEGRTSPQLLTVRITDQGPGIADLQAILDGRYRSTTGMGQGIVGARRLVDRFDIRSRPGEGTVVELRQCLPERTPLVDAATVARLAAELGAELASDPLEEVQRQNQELLRALQELGRRQHELVLLNRELEDTNRGVVALYAELDERADHLRRADELKSRFVSNMSHEFRTPVNSIQALTRILLDRSDGPLTPEQERQVSFIRAAADGLAELVNDLLDLAKVEAGKTVVQPAEFDVEHLFGALRGMLRPLLVGDSVRLVFEDPDGLPVLHSDEAKVSQILRNLISNALKFTERGEVRVSARPLPEQASMVFRVTDSGVGIAPEDHERIFQEFVQIEGPLQRRVKGTGLGLPLCRKLAGLLGGSIRVESAIGSGSCFELVVPIAWAPPALDAARWATDPGRTPLLVVEDSPEAVALYASALAPAGFQVLHARSLYEARAALREMRPAAIVLDILLRGEEGWELLTELKRRPDTREIPVAVITAVDDERKALALGAEAYFPKPVERAGLLRTLTRLVAPESVRRVLVVDDDEVARYVLGQHLRDAHREIWEAPSGADALRLARELLPDVVCLDLGLPDIDGGEVLRRLKEDPLTREIPVVIVTAKALGEAEQDALRRLAVAVVRKDADTRERALAAVHRALAGGRAA